VSGIEYLEMLASRNMSRAEYVEMFACGDIDWPEHEPQARIWIAEAFEKFDPNSFITNPREKIVLSELQDYLVRSNKDWDIRWALLTKRSVFAIMNDYVLMGQHSFYWAYHRLCIKYDSVMCVRCPFYEKLQSELFPEEIRFPIRIRKPHEPTHPMITIIIASKDVPEYQRAKDWWCEYERKRWCDCKHLQSLVNFAPFAFTSKANFKAVMDDRNCLSEVTFPIFYQLKTAPMYLRHAAKDHSGNAVVQCDGHLLECHGGCQVGIYERGSPIPSDLLY